MCRMAGVAILPNWLAVLHVSEYVNDCGNKRIFLSFAMSVHLLFFERGFGFCLF